MIFILRGSKYYKQYMLSVDSSAVHKYICTVNLEKVVHEKYIKIYLTRDYKYISHVTKHTEYIKIRIVSYDKTKV